MDANKIWMLEDFIGTNKVLFKIPVYQRNYDWSEENCNRLLDDIKNILDTGYKHFLGAVVFMSEKDGGFSLKEYTIIDGQQRLTTMMIILKALADISKDTDEECYDEIQESYLHNKHCKEEFKVKLKPVKSDNEQFLLLLQDKIDEMDEDSHIYLNYILCKNRIQGWVNSGIKPSDISEALAKLEIVEIVLTKGEDDPQIIFESINSTGLELSNSDLIRNFLLMNADNQEELYDDYWLYIEKALRKNNDYAYLNLFFMNYITFKTSSPINENKLYEKFVRLFKENDYTNESCLKELKYYADIFKSFVYEDSKYSDDIKKQLRSLRQLNQTTAYPFLLRIFDDYEQKAIDEATLVKILELLVSYIVRRLVCGIPSNSLRGLFIYLYNRIFKVESNKKKYYESINKFLYTITSRDVVPSESEFARCLKTSNIYGNSALCKFLLAEIENGGSKEVLNVENLTVEHIMPQTLNSDWKHITDEDHEKYLHTIGNLSVTGYNSELSNKSFSEKVKIIKANSKANVLNKDVIDKTVWDISAIEQRSERLSKILLNRFKIDKIVDDSIEFEYVTTITLNDYGNVTGKKLVTFRFDGQVYRQNKYALMLLDVIKLLDTKHPGKLEELAKIDYTINTRNKHPFISYKDSDMRWAWEIKDGIYLEANLSSYTIMKFIEKLMEEYKEDKNLFSISIINEDEALNDEE